jgi:phosphoribosyl 1,2-cyclic phosphate phosphodiesterase
MSKLSIEFLGSAGAIRTPRPGCQCELCCGARLHGIPWERTGPSVFVHGPDVLIDTPEESALQVDRAGIQHIAAGFYSHWHPDHTAGRRMYETRNWDWRNWPPSHECTPIYLPAQVAADFERWLGLAENFNYLQSIGLVDVRPFDKPIELGGWSISAHSVTEDYDIAQAYVFAFLFEEIGGNRRVLIAMDELYGWTPPDEWRNVDVAVLPAGVFEFHPLTGERLIPVDHPVLQSEATFIETLAMADRLEAGRLVFAHLEEPDTLTPDEYEAVARKLGAERGWDVTFAYDTLVVDCT